MRKRLAVLGIATMVTVAAANGVSGSARADATQASPPSCVVNYSVVEASFSYFYAEITVDFSGFPAEPGWRLAFSFASPQQQVLVLENEQWSQSGENVVVANPSQPTPSTGSVQVGFLAAYNYQFNPTPVNFVFDGAACTIAAISA
jgi:hypothetical protein